MMSYQLRIQAWSQGKCVQKIDRSRIKNYAASSHAYVQDGCIDIRKYRLISIQQCDQLALCFSTTASKVSSCLFSRSLMLSPDIQTSLQFGDLLPGFDRQSLLFRIFQVPVNFRPISSVMRRTPSGRTNVTQWKLSVISLPMTLAWISFSLSSLNPFWVYAVGPQTNAGNARVSVRTRNVRRAMT